MSLVLLFMLFYCAFYNKWYEISGFEIKAAAPRRSQLPGTVRYPRGTCTTSSVIRAALGLHPGGTTLKLDIGLCGIQVDDKQSSRSLIQPGESRGRILSSRLCEKLPKRFSSDCSKQQQYPLLSRKEILSMVPSQMNQGAACVSRRLVRTS